MRQGVDGGARRMAQTALDRVLALKEQLGTTVSWNDLTDKPATFPPSPHTHVIADVTGLQDALDGKQPVGSYLLTSNFTWSNLGGKPATFPPSAHGHIIADVTGLQAALDGKQAVGSYALLSDLVWSNIDGTPTTLAGYGIADAAPLSHVGSGGGEHAPATPSVDGFMSADDKAKLDGTGAGIGYATGNGGTVVQATSKSTGVTLNALSGEITMNAAALAGGAIAIFTLTNSFIGGQDVMILNHATGGTRGAYTLECRCRGGAADFFVRNNTAGSLSEAVVIRFAVIKASLF